MERPGVSTMLISMSKKKESSPQFKNVIKDKKSILKKYLREKDYATKLRQTKINNWLKNEEAYNGVTQKTLLTRSNLHIPIVFEGVQNASSKIGSSPDLEYDTVPEGNENSAEIMEHVVKQDLKDSVWDIIYENSKIECGIYGRTIYKVIPGNDKNQVELIDSLAYLISPIAKNTKDALYQGQQFIYKTIEQLYEEAEKMEYDEEELNKLKTQKVPAEMVRDSSAEASAKNLRMANMGLSNTTQYGSKVSELTEWWTYIKSEDEKSSDLYCLTVADDMFLIRKKKAIELGLKRPPFISWGIFTRGITFLSPSIADIYRDPNLAIDVLSNQIIDNNTYRNFGMMFVSSSSGLKQSSIVPRPLGVTAVQCAPNEKVQDKVWQFTPAEITDTPSTINSIKGFADNAAGLAPNLPPKGKVSVTQQAALAAQVEQKVALMKRNSNLACEELFQLMADLTAENMTKPRQVKIFGYKNLTIENVTKKNFKNVKLVSKVIPSEDSQQNKAMKQKAKIDLYQLFKDDPMIPGQIALRRSVAKTFDIPPEEIESFFTKEQDQGQATSAPAPAMPPAGNSPIPTPASALISATQQEAQSAVPRQITPIMPKQ